MTIRLRRSGIVGGVVLGGSALIALTTGMAEAQEPPVEDISVSPASGGPGTLITVSGAGCEGTEVVLFLLDGPTAVDEDSVTPGATGSWQGTLTVPADAEDDDQLAITADCFGGDVEYEDGFFVVEITEPPTTTTTTTAPTTSTTAPGSPGSPGGPGGQPGTTVTTQAPPAGAPVRPTPAPPARPVVAQPSFTG